MSESHTPGPWTVDKVTRFQVSCPPTTPDLLHSEANARLIAAAPELLQALEWALMRIRDTKFGEGDYFAAAQAVVNKARGVK